MTRALLWLRFPALLLVLVAGCSSTPVEPPAELTEFKPELTVTTLWSVQVGDGAGKRDLRLRPALDGERLYVNDHRGAVLALQAESGEQLWQVDLQLPLSSGPGVGDGILVLGSAEGELLALAADDGRQLWRAQLSSEILAPPAVGAGVVAAHTGDGKLFGLKASDGSQLWIYDRSVPTLTLHGTSSPLILSDLVLDGFASGKLALLALNDGRVLWEAPVATPRGRTELERMVDIDGPPLVIGEVVYVVGYQGRAAALDLRSGRVLWSRPVSSASGLVGDGKALYLTDDKDRVLALSRSGGASLWQQDTLQRRSLTAPAIYRDSVVVGDAEGYLHWMARSDGHFQARTRLSDAIRIAPLVADGRLYAYTRKGRLSCLEATPQQ